MKALLLIDIQNDFLPNGALAVTDGNLIVPVANKIQDLFYLVVATQDWHPMNHGSFASNHPGRNPFEKTTLAGLDQILWPNHCVQGHEGSEFAIELQMNRVEAIFRKGTNPEIDSYSGFFDNGKKKATGMGDYLKGRGVQQVYLAGLAADFCVGFTALDALELGFETYLIEDATRPIDPKGWDKMKKDIQNQGGVFVNSAQIEL